MGKPNLLPRKNLKENDYFSGFSLNSVLRFPLSRFMTKRSFLDDELKQSTNSTVKRLVNHKLLFVTF